MGLPRCEVMVRRLSNADYECVVELIKQVELLTIFVVVFNRYVEMLTIHVIVLEKYEFCCLKM